MISGAVVGNFFIVLVLDFVIVFIIVIGNRGRKQRGHHGAKPNNAWW